MPTISMFYGILVSMYALDIEKHHAPHKHVRYNEFRVVLGTLKARCSKEVSRPVR